MLLDIILERLLDPDRTPKDRMDFDNMNRQFDALDERMEDAQKARAFAAENPGTIMAAMALKMAEEWENRPLLEYDWDRLSKIAQVTVPFVEALRKVDPEATVTAALDEVTDRDLVIHVVGGESNMFTFSRDNLAALNKLLSLSVEITLAQGNKDNMVMFIYIKDVQRPA